ncbi:MAG: rod shape-determining protein MreC [bacterium]
MLERPNVFLVSSREYFVLFAAVIAALALLFNNDAPQLDAIRSFVIDRYAAVQSQLAWRSRQDYSPEEINALRRRTTSLMLENSQLREALLENHRLRRMLDYRERMPLSFRTAHILSREKGNLPTGVIIDLGFDHGVRENMPVVTPEGLAGKILKVNHRTSHVQLLLDRNFSVSARSQRSRVLGIVTAIGDLGLVMTGVPRNADVIAGDVIVTSDSSALFPPGIRIGTVTEPKMEKTSLFLTVPLSSAVNVARLEEVFVVTARKDHPGATPRDLSSGE